MNISTQFNIGDNVWVISEITKWSPCKYCLGDGKAIAKNGEEVKCGECNGEGNIFTGTKWITDKVELGLIKIKIKLGNSGIKEDIEYEGYPANTVFPTKEAALVECGIRNNQ